MFIMHKDMGVQRKRASFWNFLQDNITKMSRYYQRLTYKSSVMQYNGLLHNPVDSGPESSVATHSCWWILCSWWRTSLVPHVQCVQVHRPVGKWSQMAEESCSLQPVSIAKYQRKVWRSPWPSLVWSAIVLCRWSRRQPKPWRVAQAWLFEPENDSHPPHASSRQPKHGCSDCLQQSWD